MSAYISFTRLCFFFQVQLTSTINNTNFVPNTMSAQTRPVRYQVDVTRLLSHLVPLIGPSRPLKSRDECLSVNLHLGGRVLVRVDQVDDMLYRPLAGCHVKRDKHDKTVNLLRCCVCIVQLGTSPIVLTSDVQSKPVNACLFGCLTFFDPLIDGLAVTDSDLRCVSWELVLAEIKVGLGML